jgi:hypothetical protein
VNRLFSGENGCFSPKSDIFPFKSAVLIFFIPPFSGWADECLKQRVNQRCPRRRPLTLAAAIADMAADAAANTEKTYTLSSGDGAYNAELTLTTANSPASVTIDGGGRDPRLSWYAPFV